jgi:hypothetical protein
MSRAGICRFVIEMNLSDTNRPMALVRLHHHAPGLYLKHRGCGQDAEAQQQRDQPICAKSIQERSQPFEISQVQYSNRHFLTHATRNIDNRNMLLRILSMP